MVQTENKTQGASLIMRTGSVRFAMPLARVAETMRPLAVSPLAGAPSFIRGASLIRGVPTPVVDLASLLGTPGGEAGRFVVVRVEDRHVVLAVEAVIGIRDLREVPLSALPGLLGDARSDLVAASGASDGQLLVVLGAGRIVGDEVWEALAST